ncbi:MAG: hypothetical protein WC916_02055 [Candidatus Woesearchaeota archaeon]
MSERTHKQIVALIIIYLMISITFFSSAALATITRAEVYGKDNLNGFRAGQDNTQFFAYGTSNMSIKTATGSINMTCIPDGNMVNCTQPIGDGAQPGGLLNFTIIENIPAPRSKNLSLIVDVEAPNITLNYTRDIATGQLLINYTITDTAYPGALNCSGIKSLTIKADRDYPFAINGTPNECSKNGTLNFSITNIQQDNLTVNATAVDNVGNRGTASTVISGDFTPPLITEDFDLMIGGRIVNAISGSGDVTVSVRVQIDDMNLNPNNVFGNLTSFTTNPAQKYEYQSKPASCIKDATGTTTYDCSFNNIQLHTTNPTLTVGITATDTNGMRSVKNITKTFKLQNSAGQLLYIGPEPSQCTADKNTCYTRTGSHSFLAEFDSTSNYSLNGVRLRYDDSSNSAIAFCRFDTTWKCYSFHDVTGDVRVSIAYPSSDDYGNMVQSGERMVLVDNIAPNITGNITASTTCPVAGESLELDFKVKEAQSPELKFVVNTSEFTTHDTQVGTCEAVNEDEWDCHIEIKDFDPDAKTVDADITISDLAGNKAVIAGHGLIVNGGDPKLSICQARTDAPPNLIKEITVKDPIRIDRRTASYISVKSLVPLIVNPKRPTGVTVLEYKVSQCRGVDTEKRDIMGTGHYITTSGKNGLKPLLTLFIGKGGDQLPATDFTVNCTIEMRVREGNIVYTRPEIDVVKIKVKPYDNPLGTIDESNDKKITIQKEKLRALDSKIKTYGTIDKILGATCDLANMVVKVNSALQTIKTVVIYPLALVLEAWFGSGEGLWNAVGKTLNEADRFVQKWVWPTGMDWYATTTGYYVKIGCQIYTCQFYKPSGLYSIYMDTKSITASWAQREKDDAKVKAYLDSLKTDIANADDASELAKKTLLELLKLQEDYGKLATGITDDMKKMLKDEENIRAFIKANPNAQITDAALKDYLIQTNSVYKSKFDQLNNIVADLTIIGGSDGKGGLIKTASDKVKEDYTKSEEQKQAEAKAKEEAKAALEKEKDTYIKNAKKLKEDISAATTTQNTISNQLTQKQTTEYTEWINKLSPAATAKYFLNNDLTAEGKKVFETYFNNLADVKQLNIEKASNDEKLKFLEALSKAAPKPVEKAGPTKLTPEQQAVADQKTAAEKLMAQQKENSKRYIVGKDDNTGDQIQYGVIDGKVQLFRYSGGKDTPIPSTETITITNINPNAYADYLFKSKSTGWFANTKDKTKTFGFIPSARNDRSQLTGKINSKNFYVERSGDNPAKYESAQELADGVKKSSYHKVNIRGTTHAISPVSSQLTDQRDFISGRVVDTTGYAAADWGNLQASNDRVIQRNMKLYSELDSEEWVVNPYRSTDYDNLCIPAILYNSQKDKQVTCKYVSCLQTQAAAGVPTIICDREYQMNECLYVDGAVSKINDPFINVFLAGLLKSSLTWVVGQVPEKLYSVACSRYNGATSSLQADGTTPNDAFQVPTSTATESGYNQKGANGDTLIDGWYAVGCGGFNLILRWPEIAQVFNGAIFTDISKKSRPDDPAKIKDYCEGLDYAN